MNSPEQRLAKSIKSQAPRLPSEVQEPCEISSSPSVVEALYPAYMTAIGEAFQEDLTDWEADGFYKDAESARSRND